MAESFDFQVNDLKFRAATSDKFPYARATAPFRKEQFDSSGRAGDQSLSGWWTRGQMSFHKGAGVKYYEVLNEEVLDRFDSSVGVNVRTPGEVTLLPYVDPINTSYLTHLVDAPVYHQAMCGINSANEPVKIADTSPATTTVLTMTGSDAWDVAYAGDITYYATTNGLERTPATGTLTGLTSAWTVGAGAYYPVGVWSAKGRVFTVDHNGSWWQVPVGSTGVLAAADSFWQSGMTSVPGSGSPPWVLVDTPGPVYLAYGSTVYRVTVSDDGAVPTLTGGVTALTLPNDEQILAMGYGLGSLVLSTNRGVRVAIVQDGGGLICGPPLVDTDPGASGSAVHVRGSVAYVSCCLKGGSFTNTIVAVDLATAVDDTGLMLAWAKDYVSNGFFVKVALNGRGLFFLDDTDGVLQVSEYSSALGGTQVRLTGNLRTGRHRFGTLDLKHMHEVVVRCSGRGTIEVQQVTTAGTVSLGVIDVASGGDTLAFALTEPVEWVALKFILNRSASYTWLTPILNGYQIKALPSPVRQRLIKWPLMIQDVVRDRYGVSRGTREGAWTAWSELEALEESDALVTFTDHRTGETGEAYIESLELQTDTPTQGSNSGFGGVGYLTLRKVG